jgi:MFS family permease
MLSIKLIKDKIAWKEMTPSILLVLNSFVWYGIIYVVFSTMVSESELFETEKLTLFTAYFLGITVSAIVGSEFFPHARVKFLNFWLFIGAVATLPLITFPKNGLLVDASFALFLGTLVGIGLPSCLSYFADSTNIENRGSTGGIIWSGIGFIVVFFVFLLYIFGMWITVFALTIWRIFGAFSFMFLSRKHRSSSARKSPSYFELVRKRDLLLYLFPWVMFSIINFSEMPILERVFGEVFTFAQFAEYVFAGIFASIGGIMADFVGRKKVVITGFVMLGVTYAFMSVFAGSQSALYLFMVLDGITWGLFFSVLLTVIWGDLGEGYIKEKYYTLGGLPFLLSNFVSILVEPHVSVISPTAAFSFASFFLFLAVIPLMYAPETLPEKAMKERELKSYVEKAKKIREKFT